MINIIIVVIVVVVVIIVIIIIIIMSIITYRYCNLLNLENTFGIVLKSFKLKSLLKKKKILKH